jgi:hypothetical protein
MANQKIGITISAKDQTRAAFAKVTKALNVLRKSVFNLKTGIGGLIGVGGFVALARAGLKSIDNIGKLSRTLGMTTEQIGTLQHMANLGGTSLDTFARAARNLNKGALDFVTKGTGEAKDAFEALNISVDDVNATGDDQIALMGMIADKLNVLEPGVTKTALAMKLFGSRAVEILPALEQGSAGIKAMAAEATELGATLDKDGVAQVEAANDAIARLGTIFTSIRNKILIGVAPVIEKLATILKDKFATSLALSGDSIQKWAKNAIGSFFNFAKNALNGLENIANGAIELANKLPGMDFKSVNLQTFVKHLGSLSDIMRELPEVVVPARNVVSGMGNAMVVATEAIQAKNGALARYKKEIDDTTGGLEKMAVSGLGKLEDALVSASEKTFSFKDSFRSMAISVAQDLQRMLIRKTVTGPLAGLFNSFDFGGLFNFGGSGSVGAYDWPDGFPARANGGPVKSNKPYMVGERGPELFMPRTNGQIVSNRDLMSGGSGVNITNNYDFSGANPATISLLQQEAERIKVETFNSVFDSIGRGGRYARIVGRRT